MGSPTISQWERLKRLTFLVDDHVKTGRASTSNLPPDVEELHRLACDAKVLSAALADNRLAETVVDGSFQRFLRQAYAFHLTSDGWPMHLSVKPDGRIRTGIVTKSIDGKIEGRTTGGRRRCPSHQCNGWLVGVLWQTGQQLHICTEGWHYDPQADELRVIGGGTISARFVSPKPLGVEPKKRSEWPPRTELMKTKAWSTQSAR